MLSKSRVESTSKGPFHTFTTGEDHLTGSRRVLFAWTRRTLLGRPFPQVRRPGPTRGGPA